MDNRIRRNEFCIVGQPRCDYVFSSSRSCFVAYGFSSSPLEMEIIRSILELHKIEMVEAGGARAPGQNAFCAKICSKIITAQFCIVLLNSDERDGHATPNANVNMEYGLMLGFNKYVVPFQRESSKLPFNVAGLDTVKYSNQDFQRLAKEAIEQAVSDTTPKNEPSGIAIDAEVELFLLAMKQVLAGATFGDEKDLFEIGRPLGFNLLTSFSGMKYTYLGNFHAANADAILWKARILNEFLAERLSSIKKRLELGLIDLSKIEISLHILNSLSGWIICARDVDKEIVRDGLKEMAPLFSWEVFSLEDVRRCVSPNLFGT